jgi:hypothetical protein
VREHSPLKPKSDRARRDADAALDAATAIADEQTKAAID